MYVLVEHMVGDSLVKKIYIVGDLKLKRRGGRLWKGQIDFVRASYIPDEDVKGMICGWMVMDLSCVSLITDNGLL